MTCDRFIANLDGMDNEVMPADMAAHERSCVSCKREADILRSAVGLYRLPDIASSTDLSARLGTLVRFSPAPRREVGMREWLAVGVVMIASMVFLPQLSEFRELRLAFGSGFTLPVALAFGSAVTLYGGLFVFSHLDDFSRRLKDRGAGHIARTLN